MLENPRLVLPWQPPSSRIDGVDEASARRKEPPPGDATRSAVAGAIAGLVGGWLALAVAEGFEAPARIVDYLRVAVGASSSSVLARPSSVWLAITIAAAAGMLAGSGLGWLMRRLHGIAGRVVFGAVLVPSVWIAIDAFGLSRFDTADTELVPFVPWLLGALAYGVCVALARPVVGRPPSTENSESDALDVTPLLLPAEARVGTGSFLLLRRKS